MSAEVIVMPDAEELLRVHLDALMSSTLVFAGTPPADLSGRSVQIIRTGGARRDLVTDAPVVTFHCRDVREGLAIGLARDVAAQVDAAGRDGLLGSTPLYDVGEVTGPYLNPDPSHPDLPRATVVVRLAVRGSVV